MKVFKGFESVTDIASPVVTLGSYDGVHCGHREILSRLQKVAAARGGESTLITFEPHPRRVLHPDEPLYLLNTLPEKLALLDSLGVDNVIIIPFTEAFSRIEAVDFVRDYLVGKLHIDTLVVGFNHRLGHGKGGDPASLEALGRELGFHLETMPRQEVEQQRVSSTLVRELVARGAMQEAARYLGAPYPLSGWYEKGRITRVDPLKLLPPPGDYPVLAETEEQERESVLRVATERGLKLSGPQIATVQTGPVLVKFL